jgi:hypothetical protein
MRKAALFNIAQAAGARDKDKDGGKEGLMPSTPALRNAAARAPNLSWTSAAIVNTPRRRIELPMRQTRT